MLLDFKYVASTRYGHRALAVGTHNGDIAVSGGGAE
jgi:hypothetical protein